MYNLKIIFLHNDSLLMVVYITIETHEVYFYDDIIRWQVSATRPNASRNSPTTWQLAKPTI